MAIKDNSKALKGIIEVFFALLGLDGGNAASRIPRSLHSAVLQVLQPAESAGRRRIVVAARNVEVKFAPSRPMPEGKKIVRGDGSRLPSFQLFDPPKRLKPIRVMKSARIEPRIRFIEHYPRVVARFPARPPVVEPPPPPDGLASATRLHRHLLVLNSALENLPRLAKRLARWQRRRESSQWQKSNSPLRPGHPPGYHRKPIYEVDEVLTECEDLAWEAMKPDTS